MPAGRPSTYKPEYAQQLIDYFAQAEAFERIIDDASGKVINVPNKFPTLARFACNIGTTHVTLYEWANLLDDNGNPVNPEFANAYKRAASYQHALLIEGAMSGAYAQAFAIFFAKNNMGWKDRVETEISGKNGGAIRIEDTAQMTMVEEAKRIAFLLAAASQDDQPKMVSDKRH